MNIKTIVRYLLYFSPVIIYGLLAIVGLIHMEATIGCPNFCLVSNIWTITMIIGSIVTIIGCAVLNSYTAV